MSLSVKILSVAVGGALGAVARVLVVEWMARLLGARFPWGTLTVNLVGCFLIGVLFAFVRDSLVMNEQMRLMWMVGFLGAFTTFSSFALDNFRLIEEQSYLLVLLNVGVQNALGVILVVVGMWVTRALV